MQFWECSQALLKQGKWHFKKWHSQHFKVKLLSAFSLKVVMILTCTGVVWLVQMLSWLFCLRFLVLRSVLKTNAGALPQIRSKNLCSTWGTIPLSVGRKWGKPIYTSIKIAGGTADILNGHFLNKGLQHCSTPPAQVHECKIAAAE
jgi:hypothetical protein